MAKNVYLSADGIKEEIDPVDIHDEISAGFSRIENVIREEMAKISEHIYDAIHPETPVKFTWDDKLHIPAACRSCSNHPSNGGSGICHCTLGSYGVTSGVIYREEDLNNQPQSYTITTASTDCAWKGENNGNN